MTAKTAGKPGQLGRSGDRRGKRATWITTALMVAAAVTLFVPGLHGRGKVPWLAAACALALCWLVVRPKVGWQARGWITWAIRTYVLIGLGLLFVIALVSGVAAPAADGPAPDEFLLVIAIYGLPALVAILAPYLYFVGATASYWDFRRRGTAIAITLLGALITQAGFLIGQGFIVGNAIGLWGFWVVCGIAAQVTLPIRKVSAEPGA